MSNENTMTAVTTETSKKVYDTPYMTRGQWFKQQRENGQVFARKPKVVVEGETPVAPKAKRSKVAASDAPKVARSPSQMKAIAGYYARKRASIAA